MIEENVKIRVDDNHPPLTVLEIISIVLKKRKTILIVTGVFFLASIILYFFIIDFIYFSEASIKSSAKSSGLLGSLSEGIPDIGGLDDIGLTGGKGAKELAAYEEILNSRKCLEELILKFGLVERDHHKYLEDAVREFRSDKLSIKVEKLSGIMYVGVFDKDPILAKEMVEFLLQKLDKINIELSVTNARSNREFIEKRYFQSREELTKSEDSLKSFQQIYGVAPDLQVKAAAQTVFTIESELKAEEVKLDVLKKILSSDQPEVKTQEAKVNSLSSKVLEIQNSTDLTDLIRLGNSPQIVLSYLRLQRDVEIQTKILTFLLPLYEQSKIEEKRETPTILVLDKPYVAERKSKPKRLRMIILFTLVGFFGGSIYFVLFERIKVWRKQIVSYNLKHNRTQNE